VIDEASWITVEKNGCHNVKQDEKKCGNRDCNDDETAATTVSTAMFFISVKTVLVVVTIVFLAVATFFISNFQIIFLLVDLGKEVNDKDKEGDNEAKDDPDVDELDVGSLGQRQ